MAASSTPIATVTRPRSRAASMIRRTPVAAIPSDAARRMSDRAILISSRCIATVRDGRSDSSTPSSATRAPVRPSARSRSSATLRSAWIDAGTSNVYPDGRAAQSWSAARMASASSSISTPARLIEGAISSPASAHSARCRSARAIAQRISAGRMPSRSASSTIQRAPIEPTLGCSQRTRASARRHSPLRRSTMGWK